MSVSDLSKHYLRNDFFNITLEEKGAELQSIFSYQLQTELLWQAGEAWPKYSPVLFPIVGQLQKDKYIYNGKEYTLPRHGFARNELFSVKESTDISITFQLSASDESILVFPFHFLFEVKYELKDEFLIATYRVLNCDTQTMYCSYGAHPAFRIPLMTGEMFEDYDLQFPDTITLLQRFPLINNLIGDQPTSIILSQSKLPLTRSLFEMDAIVLKQPLFDTICLVHCVSGSGLEMHVNGWPYFGIWTAPGGNFICLEPWQGIADTASTTGKLKEKEGILQLAAGAEHSAFWQIRAIKPIS